MDIFRFSPEITEKLSEISDIISTIPTEQIINTEITEITEKLSVISDLVSTITSTQLINTEITEKLSETNDIETTMSNNSILEDVMNDKYIDLDLSNEEIKDIYEEIKNYIKENYDGKEIIINTNNVKIQISNLDEQKNSKNLSNIDLGECGEELKSKYCKTENDSIIVLKFDIKKENENSTYVGFELYDSYLKSKIDLSECSQDFFFLDIPIELEPDIEVLYDLLSKSGYNLFDENIQQKKEQTFYYMIGEWIYINQLLIFHYVKMVVIFNHMKRIQKKLNVNAQHNPSLLMN